MYPDSSSFDLSVVHCPGGYFFPDTVYVALRWVTNAELYTPLSSNLSYLTQTASSLHYGQTTITGPFKSAG